jgi:hypothetical protein
MTRVCDASDYLLATALHRYVPVEELLHLMPHLAARLPAEKYPYSIEGAASYLSALESIGFGCAGDQPTERRLFERLLLDDFRSAIGRLSEEDRRAIDDSASYEELPNRLLILLQAEYEKIGVPSPEGAIRFVDTFPAPFADRQYMALTLDAGDKVAHGVEPGVYLLTSKFVPTFAQPLILHENIHVTFGEREPGLLCRGLEEGICELFGSLYLGAKAIGSTAAANCFIYSRLRARQPAIWTSYLEFTRQALIVYRYHGMAGIAEILRGGRTLLKEVERKLWAGEQSALPLPVGNTDLLFLERAEWLLDVIARQMSVSPTAYHVMRYVHSGASVREVAKRADLEMDVVLGALEELSGHPRLLTMRSDKAVISFSEDIRRFPPHFLRYQLPEQLN